MENNKINEFENKDYFGKRWILAPGGRKIVDTSQARVWELHSEINAIGAFFRNMQSSDMSPEEFYGISLCLLRMGRRLEKISESLAKAIKESP